MVRLPGKGEPDMWRQGDVLIEKIAELPAVCVKKEDLVLARGEATGHSHRVADLDRADLYAGRDGDLFLNVTAESATIEHDEHGPITLERDVYRVWKQREYTPDRPRAIED